MSEETKKVEEKELDVSTTASDGDSEMEVKTEVSSEEEKSSEEKSSSDDKESE